MHSPTSSNPEPSKDSVGRRLSTFLLCCRERILSEWLDRVERDPRLQTPDSLNETQLRDHLPLLLDKLSQSLRDASNEGIKARSARVAALHGQIRWHQNFDIREIVHEFAVLRETIIPHLIEFQESNADVSGASWQFVSTVLHRFLDDTIRESVAHFIVINERSKKS